MRKLLIPTVLAAAALSAVGVYVLAAAGSQRPINGQIELSAGPTGAACNANSIVIGLAGTGTLAHLGRVQVTATNCTDADLESGDAAITSGTATYIAADGSTTTTSYSGHQTAPDGSIAAYTTTHSVTGGTGRLSDAAGIWTIAGTVDLSTGRLLGDVSGWVSY